MPSKITISTVIIINNIIIITIIEAFRPDDLFDP